jgi:hypothetical protein
MQDAEHHHQQAAKTPADLRRRLLVHLLVAPSVLVSDAQILNNKVLRPLISASGVGDVDVEPGEARDFEQLINSGVLQVALRNGETFRSLRDAQAARGVIDYPDVSYCTNLEEMTDGRTVGFDLVDVGSAFTTSVLAALGAASAAAVGADRAGYDRVRTWVATRNPLLYNDLRIWLASHVSLPLSVRSEVDRLAGLAYHSALPSVLGGTSTAEPGLLVATDLFRTDPTLMTPTASGLPAWSFAPDVLARLPAHFFIDLQQMPEVRSFRTQLSQHVAGAATSGIDDVRDALDAMVTAMNHHALACLTQEQRDLRRRYWDYQARVSFEAWTYGAAGSLDIATWSLQVVQQDAGDPVSLALQIATTVMAYGLMTKDIVELNRERSRYHGLETRLSSRLSTQPDSALLRAVHTTGP